jgi:hypothetical protein
VLKLQRRRRHSDPIGGTVTMVALMALPARPSLCRDEGLHHAF